MNSEDLFIRPDRFERVLLQALEEILGQKVVKALFNPAPRSIKDNQHLPCLPGFDFSPCNLISVQSILEANYGKLPGRGLSLRVGRACLKYSLREFGTEFAITESGFRLLPLHTRLKVGGEIFAGLLNQFTSQSVALELVKDQLVWHIERKSPELNHYYDGVCCALVKGFIQEAWNWMSGGKFFQIDEMICAAVGDGRCTIVINQTPMN